MSATLSTTTRPESALSRIFGASLDRIVRHFVNRAAIAHLHALEDVALRDIGLARSEIEAAVHGLAGPTKA